ncbi:MAG: hypothetical protein CMP36_01785 [Rickettsiales bacterium]|nr:hypothetical protein [Rickettsiales bacterium]OUV81422.1 MAG: hypothetical protein CBC91_02285 [Rickettsiales bacterium TMED131]
MKKSKLKVYYKKYSISSPLIVFIHGAACDHTVWVFQNRYFYNRKYSTLSLDLPGHGANDCSPVSSIKKMSKLVLNLLKKLPHKKVYLVGHSMGSLICLDALINGGSLIEKVFLIGVSYPMKVNDLLLNKSKTNQDLAVQDMINWSLCDNTKLYGSKLIGINLKNLIDTLMRSSKKGILYKDLQACNNFIIDEKSIRKIKNPIIIISGENDIMTPIKNCEILSNTLRNSTLHILTGIGHFHTLESPMMINKIIEKSIEKQ